MLSSGNNLQSQKRDIWKIFNEISPTYDLLNRILSFGLDIHWRRQLAKFLPSQRNLRILDLATGTADVPIILCQKSLKLQSVIGVDLADQMLEIGRKKIIERNLTDKISLQHADAQHLPFEDNNFDCTTIAFGIRNMENPSAVLKEMHRVLKKEGRALILEFSLPENKMLAVFYLFYLRKIVPLIGSCFSGHAQAYRYLNESVENFPYGEKFRALMEQTGFKTRAIPLLGGVASLYIGEK